MSTTTANYALLKPELKDAANITAYNSNWDTIDEELSNLNVKNIAASSNDGITYLATMNGVTELENGLEITIVPSVSNAATNPTLNLNNLGAKAIKLSLSTNTSATTTPPVSFFVKGRPVKLMYDATGGIWKPIDKQKTSASDLYGSVPIANGGTGATTAPKAREKLGITPANIGALPTILVEGEHYGTLEQRPDAGTKGRLFFVTI